MEAQIQEEHHRAELQRIREGMDGCGCSCCQELYQNIGLEKYGSRVIHHNSSIFVKAGETGQGIAPVYVEKPPEPKKVVTKIISKGILPPQKSHAQKGGIMLQGKRGRPAKPKGEEVTRMTLYRRKKKLETQGVLV